MHNPADLVSTPRRGEHLPRVLSAREAARLLDGIPAGGPLELRDRAMFELAYSSGLRAEEIVGLRLQDIDHDAEQVRVEGKGRKTRLVPVGEPALLAVALYLERARAALCSPASRGGDALFLSRTGRRWAPATCGGGCGPGPRASERDRTSPRTPCATASPRTFWTAERTSGASRRCWVTPACPALRFTLG